MKFSSHSTLLIFPGDDLIEPPSSLIRKLNREKHLSRVLFYGILSSNGSDYEIALVDLGWPTSLWMLLDWI